jgi:hypothetical protein
MEYKLLPAYMLFSIMSSVLPARTIDEAFQRDMPSRGTEVIYIFERGDTRGGAIFPGTDVLVLMLYTDCSLFALKSAHSSRLLPDGHAD